MLALAELALKYIGGVFVTKIAYELYYADWKQIAADFSEYLLKGLLKVPFLAPLIQGEIDKEVPKMLDTLLADSMKHRKPNSAFETLNHKGYTLSQMLQQLKGLKSHVPEDQLYKVSGAVYVPQTNPEMKRYIAKVAELSAYTNPLHPDIWPALPKMTAEIMRNCLTLLKAPNPEEGFGAITSGGTVSIFEAVKAYRNRFISQNFFSWMYYKIFSIKPEIIVPSTAHAAFEKAADILGCKLVSVPVNPKTQQADIKAMEAKISSNTMLLVGSLPSYPTGTLDNIEQLGAVAEKHGIGLHVDGCLGGFVVPFLAGTKFAPNFKFGFDVPGVTSFSLDSHKQGGSDKNASIILYRSFKQLGKYQTSTHVDWSGGLYATPGLSGSASGYVIASTWSMMHHKGFEGYKNDAVKIVSLANRIKQQVAKLPEITMKGQTDANVVAFKSNQPNINIHLVVDEMTKRGWHLNTLPDGFHFCLTGVQINHKGFFNEFMKDLKAGIQYAKANPKAKPKSDGAVYGATQSLPPLTGSLKKELAQMYLHAQCSVPKATTPRNTPQKRRPKLPHASPVA